ncbi:DUF5368 family protein [Aquamicrobium sp.]|uniref:DUF5368 family protein n=1 Tax=Aquamicrobium sp. TaxID=1872579 RepID=UPI00258B5A98|nr:DUF5368 family protein [Aquamicrobium sp.]MCK9550867.1 DUF5368 family protein [Aquamicrobium sp.]
MNDFNPVTLFFILSESIGAWLWVLVALAAVLLAGILAGIMKLRSTGMPARRPLVTALLTGLVTTVVFTFLVPIWTLAGPGALGAPIDILFAVLIALIPGGVAAAAVFAIMALVPNRRAAAIA